MSTRLLRLMEQVKYQQKWPTCDTRAFAEPQNRDSWLKVTVFFFIDWFGHCSYFCVNHRIQSHDCRHRFRPPSTVRPSANSCCFTAHSRGIADEVHGVSCQKWTAASWGSHPTGTLAHSKFWRKLKKREKGWWDERRKRILKIHTLCPSQDWNRSQKNRFFDPSSWSAFKTGLDLSLLWIKYLLSCCWMAVSDLF